MEFTYLDIQIPRLTDEQAAVFQQFFYAFMDAFDTQYAHVIERYYQSYQEQCQHPQILNDLTSTEDPF